MHGEPSEPPVPLIPDALLARCYADALRAHPEEACGLLFAPKDSALCDELRPCRNQQNLLHARDPASHPRDARTAYALGFRDLQLVDSSLTSDHPVRIIYHSHVNLSAYFSEEDARGAAPDGVLQYPVDYLVLDCHPDHVRGAKLFRFRQGLFICVQEYGPLHPDVSALDLTP